MFNWLHFKYLQEKCVKFIKNYLGAQYMSKLFGNRENQKIMFSSFEINLILILDHQSSENRL